MKLSSVNYLRDFFCRLVYQSRSVGNRCFLVGVNEKRETSTVETDEGVADDALIAAVAEAGYEVKKIS